jgi:amino acid adenylation domain-containing protein
MSSIVCRQNTRAVNTVTETQPSCFQHAVVRECPGSAPLSFAEEEVWSQALLAPDVHIHNPVLSLRRKGAVNGDVLKRTLNEIIRRHESLRTTFPIIRGMPTRTIVAELSLSLCIDELTNLRDEESYVRVLRNAAQEAQYPFNLAEGPLLRARLLRLSSQDHILLVPLHPIIADDWSLTVFAREIDTLYEAYSTQKQSPLSNLPFQYADYARQQRNRVHGDIFKQEISYWCDRLAGIPPVSDLPTDRPRRRGEAFRQERHSLVLPTALTEALNALSHQEGVNLFTTLLAAFQTLIFRYTGQNDIALGSFVRGREADEAHTLIGRFAQAVLIRTDLEGDPTFRDLMQRVEHGTRIDREHYNVPFHRLLTEVHPKRDPNTELFCRVLFSFTPWLAGLQSGWEPANIEMAAHNANVEVQLQFYEKPEGSVAHFLYDSDLFDTATIHRMAGHFQTLLQSVVANSDLAISRLPLLTSAERHRVLFEWNNTHKDYPRHRCVHQLFEEQVARTPHAIALVFENQELTYLELNNRANQFAHHLVRLGVGPDVLVGICIERCPDMVTGLLGIFKAGGAYVPLDPEYPSDRLFMMLQDSQLSVLVTQTKLSPKFAMYTGQLVCIDSEVLFEEGVTNLPASSSPQHLAYVIYTSGSTGKPKGVQINHLSLVNFLTSMRSRPGLTAQDTLVAVTTISFDIAALELYLPLIAGGRLVLASREIAADGVRLKTMLGRVTPTVMQATPATWRLLLEAGWEGSGDLKLLCGGEALSPDLAIQLMERASSVWNMYGPTETTVWSTIGQVTQENKPITIGSPIANTEVYVLDSHLEPVPPGATGDLYIGGDGVARGYLRRPELTAEKFICHPFRDQHSGCRLYRTGDLSRFRSNGELECLGRDDDQVKVRGFRIELGEIESALSAYAGVKQNVVVAREDTPGDKRLVAYVVVGRPGSITTDALRESLKQKLPAYMVPSRFVFLEKLPLTPNGKVNRRALPRPDEAELSEPKEYVAPRNAIESRMVKIWESVLGVHRPGIHENFFELGGHSLLVGKLVRQIALAWEKDLSMAQIFEAPTIGQQAAMLANGYAPPPPSAVIPIQPAGRKPPLFCIGFGAGPVFLPLAQCLGYEQPLLGLDPTLLTANKLNAMSSMESIAASLIAQIKKVQPQGPYFLGGFCAGGLMAYETACQLVGQGEQVALLALFEPQVPTQCDGRSKRLRVGRLGQRLMFHLRNLQHFNLREGRVFTLYRLKVLLQRIGRFVSFTRYVSKNSDQLQNRNELLDFAYRIYRPRSFPGHISLFQATDRPSERHGDRQYWGSLAGSIEVYEVPAEWNWVVQFFLEPNVHLLANKLKERLG